MGVALGSRSQGWADALRFLVRGKGLLFLLAFVLILRVGQLALPPDASGSALAACELVLLACAAGGVRQGLHFQEASSRR